MNSNFEILKTIIESRRTVKPEIMNGDQIPDEHFNQLISLADWAPTHGRTEPWRFIVYTAEALKNFCFAHAEMYKENTPVENFNPATYDNLMHKGDKASHLIIAVMKRGSNPKIPALEEIASASASVDNVLLGAAALGISAMWNTGGLAHKQPMKDFLQLGDEDVVLGLIYLGYCEDPPKEGKRTVPLNEKVIINR
jgi:nitroreductase